MDAVDTPLWEQRFRASRHTLPAWAKSSPERCVFVSDRSGNAQVYCWDRTAGTLRQVTHRPSGAQHCAVEASGEAVWWFADTEGDERGQWMRQPFGGGPDEPAVRDLKPYWPAGLALGLRGHNLLGHSTEHGTDVSLVLPGGASRRLYRHEEPAYAVDLSRDLTLAVIAHSERGDLWEPGVRVLTTDGDAVADLEGEAVGFSPVPGDNRLLVLQPRQDRWEPVIHDPRTGESVALDLGLPGETSVEWSQDATSLLVVHDHQARSQAFRYDLAARELTRLEIPDGTIEHARTRPGGDVWFQWSDSAHPPVFRALDSDPRFPATSRPPQTALARDIWVDGPGGRVHALLSLPRTGTEPHPAVFLLHGGPDEHDRDAFDPEAAAWTDEGFAVVRVNYRGSTGYGRAWTEALRSRVGHTELEDVTAVRQWAVDQRIVDPGRLVLAGWSWGGYLTLLGLGTRPDDWTVGLAGAPVADCAGAHEQAMDDIKALDRTLFGGTPEEVPEIYRDASPATYADAVSAPVFICAGVNDARCPIDQARAYADRLEARGLPVEFHAMEGGHSVTAVEERVTVFRRQMEFTRTHINAVRRLA
ncbi:prolyl oligopeptidase family serine peptidase [Streptomyces peucetius]|uniref:Prolyl oligopeptidase family serine peptidase n=1 Tax=Streptomyces peucetius TaxID=1950 RepID=A0ABY6IA91_STRPE|nr:prolyl oligopeptidase family serine peptidase [Streptomyces peucetius]UYQ62884.1 prolyl oligopeptidase family serine peptidase [Streptomyces peucetius]